VPHKQLTIVYTIVCSRIDYGNSLLIDLPKVRLFPIQSVLNAAARLIARLPKFSHMYSFVINQLHWLPLCARIQFKLLVLVLKYKLDVASKYLRYHSHSSPSAISHQPLRSLDWRVLFSRELVHNIGLHNTAATRTCAMPTKGNLVQRIPCSTSTFSSSCAVRTQSQTPNT